MSLVGIVYPLEKLGFKTRKDAFNGLVGSGVLVVVLLVAGQLTEDDEQSVVAYDKSSTLAAREDNVAAFEIKEKVKRDNSWRLKAVDEVSKEKLVFEAMFPNNSTSSFWVSMRDDGSRRDGFAEYLCLVLKETGMPVGKFVTIRIWDA